MNYTLKYHFVYFNGIQGMAHKKCFKHRKDLVNYIRSMLSRNVGFTVLDAWYRDNYLNNRRFF